MDNDLEALGTLLAAPSPSPEAVEAGRRRLQQAIRGPVRGHFAVGWRRPGLLALGFGLAAAAAAGIAISVALSPATAPARLSGRQILLDAATAAAAQPGPGTYWYLKESYSLEGKTIKQSTWTARDGAIWVLAPSGKGAWQMGGPAGISVGFCSVTFSQLQGLPTSPPALEAWIVKSFNDPHPRRGCAPVTTAADQIDPDLASVLSSLLYEVPAPPALRATALQALASLPDVKNAGPVPGGEEFIIETAPGENVGETLVIDPATSMLLSISNGGQTTKILAEEWTNTKPAVVRLPAK